MLAPTPLHGARKRPSPMTIALGFTAGSCFIVATDSQTTDRADNTIIRNSTKLVRIQFHSGHSALVACTGVANSANMFFEKFERMAMDAKLGIIKNQQCFVRVAGAAMAATKHEILSGHHSKYLSAGHGEKIIDDFDFRVLLAFAFEERIHRYLLMLGIGSAAFPQRGSFDALGVGKNIAITFLQEHDLGSLNESEAVGLAYYVVEMCKAGNGECGGAPQIGCVDAVTGRSEIYDWDVLSRMASAVGEIRHNLRHELSKNIAAKFHSTPLEIS